MQFHSFNKMMQDSFSRHWERPAISNYGGEPISYAGLCELIEKLHIMFEQQGINRGDKIAICGKNQRNWAVSFLASITYGAVPVPLLHEFTPANIQSLVQHSGARLFFVDEAILPKLDMSAMPSLVKTVEIGALPIDAGVEKAYAAKYPEGLRPEDLSYYEDSADELAIINYTSGTSGFSKGVMIPYRALVSNLEFACLDALPMISEKDTILSMLPMAHMYGMMFEFLFCLVSGAHLYYLAKAPSPAVVLDGLKNVKPEVIITVPLVIEKIYRSKIKPVKEKLGILFRLPGVKNILLKKVRTQLEESFGGQFEEIIGGGAALNPEVERFFREMKFRYTVGYGMTECAPIIAYAHWNVNKTYSCGKAVRNIEIRVDSSDPRHIPGEVQVRGDNVFLGYYNNEEATKASFTEDGWFRTGDMGIIDADGFLFLKGRSKCMILGPSGQNIYPEELEGVLNSRKYVIDSLVIEDKDGIVGLVYPDYAKAETDGLDKDALEKHLTDSLPQINKEFPAYSRIRRFEFRSEDFERTPKHSIKRYLYMRDASK